MNDRNEQQHDHRVSIKELAELIGVSTDTIRRAFRKGEILAIRVKTALRFDLDEVLRYMQRNADARYGRNPGAPGGDCRPRAGHGQTVAAYALPFLHLCILSFVSLC